MNRGWIRIAIILVVAAVAYWKNGSVDWGSLMRGGDGGLMRESRDGAKNSPAPGKRSDYEMLEGVRLKEDRNNDGDSFQVSHDAKSYTLRLYYVDAPEKRRHQHNGKRIAEQGQYFGGLSEAETIKVGLEAKDLALDLMKKPFTVMTKWEGVYGNERHYAFVKLADGRYLSEALMKEGLVRIHTKGEETPDGRSYHAYKKHLQNLEREAKKAGKGGWRK